MDKVELLYDHYKESFELIKKSEHERAKLYTFLFGLIAFLFLFNSNPTNVFSVMKAWVKENHKIDMTIELNVLHTLIWSILLYISIRYYQINCYIERQYIYIHKLEENIKLLISFDFDRESKNYLEHRPMVLKFISLIYKWIFPLLLGFSVCVKMIGELKNWNCELLQILNFVMFACIFTLTIQYVCFLNFKPQKAKK